MADDKQKKRKLSENEEEEEEEKKTPMRKVITAKTLREEIKTSGGLTALNLYFKSDSDQDLVGQYLEEGGSIQELISMLTDIDMNKNMSHAMIVFTTMHKVIMKIISTSPDEQENLSGACREFTKAYLFILLNHIKEKSTPVSRKKTIFKLLTAIVSVNEVLAREVLSQIDFDHDELMLLTKHFHPNDKKSLRVAFINFLLAFIIERPYSLVQKIIIKKGLLISIFQGLKFDNFVTAELVLSSLHTYIVKNKETYKSQRLLVFNSHTLLHLLNVYNWNPYAIINHDKNKQDVPVREIQTEEKETIRQCVHSLLMTLCTSHKIGVIFNDPTYGTSGKQYNHTMHALIEGMGQPWEDPLKEELTIAILQQCPDLLKLSMPLFSPFLASENKFIKAATFYLKIIEKINIDVKTLSPKISLRVAREICAPVKFMKAISEQNFLVHSDSQVRLTVLECLIVALEKLSHFTREAKEAAITCKNFDTLVTQYLIFCLCDASVLMECLTMWKNDKDSSDREDGLYKTVSLLLLYNSICPQLLDTIRFSEDHFSNVQELVKEMADSNSLNVELCNSIAVKGIQLELIISPQDPTKEVFCGEVKELCRLVSQGDCKAGIEVLGEILKSTGYMEGLPGELPVWLHFLEEHPKASDLFPDALILAAKDTADLIRMTMKAEEATSSIQQEFNIASLTLDDLLSLAEEDKGNSCGEKFYTGLNVSLMVPAILKAIDNKEKVDSEENSYITKVLIQLFHHQVSFQAFVSLLKNFNSKVVATVLPYMESWDKMPSVLELEPFVDTVYHNISQYFLSENYSNDPLEKVDRDDVLSLELCFQQTIFTLCQLSNVGMANEEVISKGVSLLEDLLKSHKTVNPNVLANPQLLRDFHPLSRNANLTKIIFCLTSHLNASEKMLAPFSHRLVFDLKYSLSKSAKLKGKDIGLVLEAFSLPKEDVESLLKQTVRIDKSLLTGKHAGSGWLKVETHLLKKAVEYKIVLSLDELTSLCEQMTYVCQQKAPVEEILQAVCHYLESYTSPDFYGDVIVSFEKLLGGVCRNEEWNKDLSRWLLGRIENMGEILSELPVDRAAPLLDLLAPIKMSELLDLHTTCIMHSLTQNPPPDWLQYITPLVHSNMRIENCEKICHRIKKKEEHVVITKENLEFLHSVFKKSSSSCIFLNLMQNWLLRCLKGQDQSKSEELCRVMIECMGDLEKTDEPHKCSMEITKLLISKSLKSSISVYLRVVRKYIDLESMELTAEIVFQLVTAHSCFLDVFLSSKDIKFDLICLLAELIDKDELIMRSSHIPVYLSAYNATLSRNDQTILKLLQLYEKRGLAMLDWKPVMWGEQAVDHYCLRDKPTLSRGSSLRTIQLLDIKMVKKTITNYPIDRGLEDEDFFEEKVGVYDPAFLLPLLSHLLAPGSDISGGRQVAMNGVLALAFSSLSSNKPKVRLVGYHILQRHLSSLPESTESMIWTHFIEAVQNGMSSVKEGEKGNPKPSSIITVFLARTSLIMTEPPNPMYKPLYNFISVKPVINLTIVPAFFELFNSTKTNRRVHQEWILKVLRDGLREQCDLQLALDCLIFKFILFYHCCSLADPNIKLLIEEIVQKCLTCIDVKKYLLTNKYSILAWLSRNVSSTKILDDISSKINAPYKPLLQHIRSMMEVPTDTVE